jgi:hypothetical protein
MSRTKGTGEELDIDSLATVAGGWGWLENNWLFGETEVCKAGQQRAYDQGYAEMKRPRGLYHSDQEADAAGKASAYLFWDVDPACE